MSRADYTQALLACSVSRRAIAASPLALGEVGVKERVKSVINYKKPAFWAVVLAAPCAAGYQCSAVGWTGELFAKMIELGGAGYRFLLNSIVLSYFL